MTRYFALLLTLTLLSCKPKAVVAEGKAKAVMAAADVIESHYANNKDFSTLYIKSSARYQDQKQTQNVTAEIRIKKDEKILVSIRFLGITMAKALITPNEVHYYEKLDGTYFAGDYSTLSKWLGTDLDFAKVQNMLIGQAMDDLSKGNYSAAIVDKMHRLTGKPAQGTIKSFFFEAENFLIKKQEIAQEAQRRQLTVSYPSHVKQADLILPSSLAIEAVQKEAKTTIDITYNNVTVNEQMSFPYSVPEGYERVFID